MLVQVLARALMPRNSQQTRKKIIAAVGRLLSRSGFRNLGVNAIAREAGVDKVLIYRYFGGIPELLRAYAEEGDFWPTAEELLAGLRGKLPPSDADLAAKLLIEFGRALRRRPITQEIMRWELLERNELTDALAHYREEQGMKLIRMVRDARGLDLDIQALGSLLSAGQTYLILRSKTAAVYNGLRLGSDRDWNRIEKNIEHLVRLAFARSPRSKTTNAPPRKRVVAPKTK
jgi:AcrR family transcriptional regulator